MIAIPKGFLLKTERDYSTDDLISLTFPTYQAAFKEGVWKEDLSEEEIIHRLIKTFSADFKGYWLVDKNGRLACTSWYQFTDIDYIRSQKGNDLAEFVTKIQKSFKTIQIVWHAETITNPEYWGNGFARLLKNQVFKDLKMLSMSGVNLLILTRMRDDNKKIISINESFGMNRTGIRMFCSTDPSNPDKMHEYWFMVISS